MKKYFLILLTLILVSITGCNSSKLKQSELEKSVVIYSFETENSYLSRDDTEIKTIVNAINNSKKASSKYVKKVIDSNPSKPDDFFLTFQNKNGMIIYGIRIDGDNLLILEEHSPDRLIQNKDLDEFKRILNKAISK